MTISIQKGPVLVCRPLFVPYISLLAKFSYLRTEIVLHNEKDTCNKIGPFCDKQQ